MTYPTSTILKALSVALVALMGAGGTGAEGLDLASLDLAQWLTAAGTALLAGAAILHNPKKSTTEALGSAGASVTDALTKAAVEHEKLTQQALDGIQKAVGDLTSLLPAQTGAHAQGRTQAAPPATPASTVQMDNTLNLTAEPGPLTRQMIATAQRRALLTKLRREL
ncbi:MAG: hypothetical protein WBH51_01480 [Mycolicibacter algericus]|uniref:hypothetical protein n=1 Tax=Mycolicibacter algericus TaxID=1288388 RepID=UPI003C765F67